MATTYNTTLKALWITENLTSLVPLTGLSLSLTMNAIPSCLVTCAQKNTNVATFDINTVVAVGVSILINGVSTPLVLFKGKVSMHNASYKATESTYEETTTIGISCITNDVDDTPPLSLTHVDSERGNLYSSAAIAAGLTNCHSKFITEQESKVQNNLGSVLVAAIQTLQLNLITGTNVKDSLANSLYNIEGKVDTSENYTLNSAVIVNGTQDVTRSIISQATASLKSGQGYLSTFRNLLSSFFLMWRPYLSNSWDLGRSGYTVMQIKPYNPWYKTPALEIDIADCYSLNIIKSQGMASKIDAVAVPNYIYKTGQGFEFSSYTIYGLNTEGDKLVEYVQASSEIDSYARILKFNPPSWLNNIYRPNIKTNTEDRSSAVTIEDTSDTTINSIAGVLATTVFGTHSLSPQSASLGIPFTTYLELKEYIGEVVTIKDEKGDSSYSKIPSQLYGVLNSLSLKINISDTSVNLDCQAEISFLRDKETHEMYSIDNDNENFIYTIG